MDKEKNSLGHCGQSSIGLFSDCAVVRTARAILCKDYLLAVFIVGLEKQQLGMLTKWQTKRVVIGMHRGQGVNKREGKKGPQATDSVTFTFDWTANAPTTWQGCFSEEVER